MKNEKGFICVSDLIDDLKWLKSVVNESSKNEVQDFIDRVETFPKADVVSRGLYDQIKWERDVAIEQLESYGISLGEKADVAKVVHGWWSHRPDERRCPLCGYHYSYFGGKDYNYCPNCGATMDLKGE